MKDDLTDLVAYKAKEAKRQHELFNRKYEENTAERFNAFHELEAERDIVKELWEAIDFNE